MYLAINPSGQYWNGFAWSQQGKEFLTPAGVARSLHEEGEDLASVIIVPTEEARTST
jgi:hypothetical protein